LLADNPRSAFSNFRVIHRPAADISARLIPAKVRLNWNVLKQWAPCLTKTPFAGVIAITVFLHYMHEFYPFSHYPMYAALKPMYAAQARHVTYYYLSNSKGEPIAQRLIFGVSSPSMAKMLATRQQKAVEGGHVRKSRPELLAATGRATLEYLMSHASKDRQPKLRRAGLQLHQVDVTRQGDRFVKVASVVAELLPQ
jgi:hypothetical protein